MTTTYNDKTGLWTCVQGNITVHGPSRGGCEQRVREMEERFDQIQRDKEKPC